MNRSDGSGTILFGGSGFLGPYILERAPEMVSVGRRPPPTKNRHVQIDSLDNLDVLDSLSFDKVIYIIGNTDHYSMERETIPRGEPTAFDYHLIPFVRTMEQLKNYPIKKFIHFSSVLVYDEQQPSLPVSETAPISPYRNRYVLSKYLTEEASKFYERWMPIITVRFSNLYGPTPLERFDLIHRLCRALLDNGRAEVWSTRPSRDFIFVEDAAEAILQLLETDYSGLLNLGTGTMTSVKWVVDILQEISGCPIRDLDREVPGPMRFQCDMTRINRLIEWRPEFSIEDGILQTWQKMKLWRAAKQG